MDLGLDRDPYLGGNAKTRQRHEREIAEMERALAAGEYREVKLVDLKRSRKIDEHWCIRLSKLTALVLLVCGAAGARRGHNAISAVLSLRRLSRTGMLLPR